MEAGDESMEAGDESMEAGDESMEAGDESMEAGDESVEMGDESMEGAGTLPRSAWMSLRLPPPLWRPSLSLMNTKQNKT